MLWLYRLATFLGKPLVRPLLWLRRRRNFESNEMPRIGERFGKPSAERPKGRIFWFNTPSVGESNSIIPVVDEILKKYPKDYILITTTTVTGSENVAQKYNGKRVIHQFLPVDRGAYVRRFLDYWKPSVGFFVDNDFWPNLILAAKSRKIPLVSMNGRMSNQSFKRWMTFARGGIRKLMSAFIYGFAKSPEDKAKLEKMGMSAVVSVGDLKYSVPPLAYDKKKLAAMKKQIGARKAWTAASTHAPEEEWLVNTISRIRLEFPDTLTIIAPRHKIRAAEIKAMLASHGLKCVMHSKKPKITPDVDVYISDDFNESPGLFYAAAPMSFIGNSLIRKAGGGHNPMEPAQLGSVPLAGKFVENFQETYDMLERDSAAIMVEDANELGTKVAMLMGDEKLYETYRANALKVAEREAGVLGRVMDRLEPILTSVGK
jgi:3-deoxy-D-manno-octulosonic-acid transferase